MVFRRPLTFGQQAIRISASAAVCGLSLAFILGSQIPSSLETNIGGTVSPVELPVLQPLASLLRLSSSLDWSKQFSADPILPDSPTAPVLSPTVAVVQKSLLAPSFKTPQVKRLIQDQVRTKVSTLVRQKSKQAKNTHDHATQPEDISWITKKSDSIIKLDSETLVSQSVMGPEFPELYELLLNEKYAYQRLILNQNNLNIQAKIEPSDLAPNKNSILYSEAQDSYAPVENRKTENVTASKVSDFTVLDLSQKLAPANVQARASSAQPTLNTQKGPDGKKIKGILIGDVAKYPGHFEIGLYEHIGEDSHPVGAPVAWESIPAGYSKFNIPLKQNFKLQKGYLFAQYFDNYGHSLWIGAANNPLKINSMDEYSVLSIQLPIQDKMVTGTMSANERANNREADHEVILNARISTMFADFAQNGIAGATVRVRGTHLQAKTNLQGNFELPLPSVRSQYLLELSKPGYLPSIVSLSGREIQSKQQSFQLASKQLINRMAINVGIRQASEASVLLLKITNSNKDGMPGFTGQLGLQADGPYYFSNEGLPVRSPEHRATGFDGRMIFFNVAPGVGTFEGAVAGAEAVAPIGLAAIEGGELIYKELELSAGKIEGKLFDATKRDARGNPIALSGARVRVEGSSDWASTDAYGNFSLPQTKFFNRQEIQLEVNHEGFYTHSFRTYVPRPESTRELGLYLFPRNYVNKLANRVEVELDPYAGLIFGSLGTGFKLRVDALSDHSSQNSAKDFYFDKSQDLRGGSHSFTDEKFGTFVIFNVPKGRGILHGYDGDAKIKYSNVVHINPSTVSVVLPQDY